MKQTADVFGLVQFPKRFSSINNQPYANKLTISGKSFRDIWPISKIKTESYELIEIQIGTDQLTLELKGKPISRNGDLKVNGRVFAQVTCH